MIVNYLRKVFYAKKGHLSNAGSRISVCLVNSEWRKMNSE